MALISTCHSLSGSKKTQSTCPVSRRRAWRALRMSPEATSRMRTRTWHGLALLCGTALTALSLVLFAITRAVSLDLALSMFFAGDIFSIGSVAASVWAPPRFSNFPRSLRRLCGWSALGWRRWPCTGQGCLCHCPCDLKLILGRSSATLPESLFLKALTEGLPMIRPGAVDICRPMMVRYSVI